MVQINVGAGANDGTGDPLRTAFQKVNANTTELGVSITTSSDSTFNGVEIGKGNGNIASNLSVGINNLTLNTTGSGITSVGNGAGYSNTTGGFNSFLGRDTGLNNTIGSYNTYVGHTAGKFGTEGSYNSSFGHLAGANVTTSVNTSSFGFDAQATGSNQVTLGNTAVTALRCNVQTITSLSDERDKTDILEISEGLDFVSKLKPVSFTWNQRDNGRIGIKSAGFIAQDLLQLQNDSLIGENLDLVSDLDPEKLEARYANLLPIMVKAIQELKAEIELLKQK